MSSNTLKSNNASNNYIRQINKSDAISIPEFNNLLRDWYLNSNEKNIKISSEIIGVKAWVHVKQGQDVFRLNSDTKRTSVKKYLDKYSASDWILVSNRNGKKNKVAFGDEQNYKVISGFYLYL